MPAGPKLDIEAILRTLDRHGVEYIVVGGVCAVLHGAPIATFDLDVVHSRSPENVARLMRALRELKSHYRAQPEKKLRPAESHLSGGGHQLLLTRFGPLDVLGLVGAGLGYEDLLPHTVWTELGDGLRVRLLDLETLIQTKRETAGEKDLAVLATLRRILKERSET
ncbi:MAG: hypothetical protein ACE141_09755 [Bryobacteraceae bacterium]